MALFMVGQYVPNPELDKIYGAEWDGTSRTDWTRTDSAINFSAPVPYYSGMSATPSSPFDTILPWSGMRRVSDASAGELVEIPKFYYKWTRTGSAMKLQISMKKHSGFLTSPAHADRGDGVGERPYVYVGRYHCSTNDYKSRTQVQSKANTNILTFRSGIHGLGANVWQQDFAMWWTIRLLYLVEFANWNSQAMINDGCRFGGNDSYGNGNTDGMPYHTGTPASSRSASSYLQYRYIENLWSDMYEFVDGIKFQDTAIYVTKNPADFGNDSAYINVGTRPTTNGYIKEWNIPAVSGYEYAMYASSVYTGSSAYVSDAVQYSSGNRYLITSSSDQDASRGLFYMGGLISDSQTSIGYSSRLMLLPPSRLSA